MAQAAQKPSVSLHFVAGTVEVRGLARDDQVALPPSCRWDRRSACFRAPAVSYASIVLCLIRAGISYEDDARQYPNLSNGLRVKRSPRPFQSAALEAWRKAMGRGVVVLPTGAGKSHLALMAMDLKRRATLVVAPTLDLVRQWYDQLRLAFGGPVGIVGGGEHDVQPITVTTYDSAHIHMEHLGNRFGLVVFDECHHLPGQAYSLAAESCLAPFRLGLTATPERTDGRDGLLDALVGELVYRLDIIDISGEYLADYDTVQLALSLSEQEREAYDTARATYVGYIRRYGIRLGGRDGWSNFIMRASQSEEGLAALRAHRRQREIAFSAAAKLECVADLLLRHRADRAIIFTQHNADAYAISRRFLLPAITHQTPVSERSEILAGLSDGTYNAVVTSKVLNEGVDVPAANVAVVVSGSGSVREHVQRLGRVLRKKGDKRAVLYELVTADTSEEFTSSLRREHSAYR